MRAATYAATGPVWEAKLIGLIVSAAAGVATPVLVLDWRLGLARVNATLAVAGILAGSALAQRPVFCRGCGRRGAAAGVHRDRHVRRCTERGGARPSGTE